jgi:hypothetical protein
MPDFTATIGYLARDDLYLSEKPYDVVFDTNNIPGVKRTNHRYAHEEVQGQ